jgi:hypothetical protein
VSEQFLFHISQPLNTCRVPPVPDAGEEKSFGGSQYVFDEIRKNHTPVIL